MELLPGYTVKSAGTSRRRQEAERIVRETIDEQMPAKQMRWVRVTRDEIGEV
jgi:hypothetical protein